MTGSRLVNMALAGALACLFIPLGIYRMARFSPQLTGDERAVLEFTPAAAGLASSTWQPANLACPVSNVAESGASGKPAMAAKGLTEPRMIRNRPVISFILRDETGGMAIVDGVVVKEGSSFSGGRIVRIESNRILLENKKGKQWLSME